MNEFFSKFYDIKLVKNGIYSVKIGLDEISNFSDLCIVTGRCPSYYTNLLHLIHYKNIFEIQKRLGINLIFCFSPEEAFIKKGYEFYSSLKFTQNTINYLLALTTGKLKILSCLHRISPKAYRLLIKTSKFFTLNTIKNTFGITDSNCSGEIITSLLEVIQILYPSYYLNKHSFVISPISQLPYLRLANDIAKKLNIKKAYGLFYEKVIDLRGGERKISDPRGALYLEDSTEEVKKKIDLAFTGGQKTKKEQKEKGGNPSVCSIYWYFKFFKKLQEVEEIEAKCKFGELSCGECKNELTICVLKFVESFTKKLNKVVSKNEINKRVEWL